MIHPGQFGGWEPGHLFSAVRRVFRPKGTGLEAPARRERQPFFFLGKVKLRRGSWWAKTARGGRSSHREAGWIRLDHWEDLVDEVLYGQLVRQQRRAAEMTARELGVMVKASESTIFRIELGTAYARKVLKRRLQVALRPPGPPRPAETPAADETPSGPSWIEDRQKAERAPRFEL